MTGKRQQIADDLRARIARKELRPGDEVPSERAGARQWGVARDTFGEALRDLTLEGLLTSGRPRRVAGHNPRGVHVLRDADTAWDGETPSPGADAWVGDMHRAGYEPGQDIDVTHPPAGPEVAALLGTNAQDTVTMRHLVRTASSRPDNLITFWFPAGVAAGTPLDRNASITEGSLGWLEKHHGPLAHDRPQISARPPRPAETQQLRIPAGWPVLVVWRASRSPARPVVCSMAIYPADRTVLV